MQDKTRQDKGRQSKVRLDKTTPGKVCCDKVLTFATEFGELIPRGREHTMVVLFISSSCRTFELTLYCAPGCMLLMLTF